MARPWSPSAAAQVPLSSVTDHDETYSSSSDTSGLDAKVSAS